MCFRIAGSKKIVADKNSVTTFNVSEKNNVAEKFSVTLKIRTS